MKGILIFLAIMIPYVFIMWSNFWCKREYEGTEEEVITKTWGGKNDDEYTCKFVPMYQNFWGKIYYGEFDQRFGKETWRRVEYHGGFLGDPNLFTRRRIYHDARFNEDYLGKIIKREAQHSDRTAEWLTETMEESNER